MQQCHEVLPFSAGSCSPSRPSLQSQDAEQRPQGTGKGCGSGPKPSRRRRRASLAEMQPKGSSWLSKHRWRWGGGYLQVRADSPQDIVDAVAGNEGHKDVLQKKERSCWDRFPFPSQVRFPTGWGQADILPLKLPSFGSRTSPQASPRRVSLLLFLQPAKTQTRFY